MAAQWTTPELLVSGAATGVTTIKPMSIKTHFGRNSNQIYHTFRHVDDLGISRYLVHNSIVTDLKNISSTIKVGQAINRTIIVEGQELQYTVFKLNNNELNVGRIHAKTETNKR